VEDAELRALLAAQQAQIAELLVALRPQPSLALPLAELYAAYEKAQKSRPAWMAIAYRLRGPVRALGPLAVMSLKVADWTGYRAPLEKKFAVSTLNQELAWTKAMLNWGVREGLIPHNPLAVARKKKLPKKHNETAPDERDVGRLLAEANPRDRVIVLCAADSGMRRGEIRNLQWTWIDRVEMALGLPNWACKNQRGGAVPLTRRTLAAIDSIPRDIRSSYVLTNSLTGGPYSTKSLSEWFRVLADAAGVVGAPGEVVTLHSLRHAYATNAVRRGVGIKAVSKVLRHASLAMTDSYVQSNDADLRAARETFEAGIERDKRQ
jgi:integrase